MIETYELRSSTDVVLMALSISKSYKVASYYKKRNG